MENTNERSEAGKSKGAISGVHTAELPADYLYLDLILCIEKNPKSLHFFYGVITIDSGMIV